MRSELGVLFWGAGFGLVFIYSLIVSTIQYRMIKFRQTEITPHLPETSVDCGTDLDIRFEINRGFTVLPGCRVNTVLTLYWHNRIITGDSLYNSGSSQGAIRLEASYRGDFESRGACFQLTDAAGFFKYNILCGKPETLAVRPELLNDNELPRIYGAGGENLSRIIKKKRSDDLIETRQYYPGDDIRRMNWKTYAHLGELFIRLGEEMPNPESRLLIVPDLSGDPSVLLGERQSIRYLDYIISYIAGIMRALNEAGVAVESAITEEDLSGLWWSEISYLKEVRKSSCLLVSSAFSNRADVLCEKITGLGMPVNAVIPILPVKTADKRPEIFKRMLFIHPADDGSQSTSGLIKSSAAELSEKLSGLRGVNSVKTV